MKKFKQIILTLILVLLTQAIAFAQAPPSDFGTSSTPTETNATDTPIDTYVLILLVVGLFYASLLYKKTNKA